MNTYDILPEHGTIAFYLRLSTADGDNDENNSIGNQRRLLREYVSRLIEKNMPDQYEKDHLDTVINAYISGISEYIDDGFSGTHFDRPAFRKMIEDAKRKKISTIIVKDTSRLGRDHIEVGDYMEQIFPLLGVRFIAVNSGYDSENYKNITMGAETSIMNLVNAEYSKDLSRKIKSARSALWKCGIPTSGKAPFGYISQNKRYAIDPETAPIVRMIFEKAIGGWNTGMIAEFLNEQNIPTPGMFIRKNHPDVKLPKIVSDGEWLWDTRKIYSILKNYSYTGSMVHGKSRNLTVGSHHRRSTDVSEQVVIRNSHQPIVSPAEWDAAQFAIRKIAESKPKISSDLPLAGKIRCGNCGLAMEHCGKISPVVYCGHAKIVGKASKCCRTRHDARKIEEIAAHELKCQLRLLRFFGEKIRENMNHSNISALRKQTESALENLRSEKIDLYESYSDGLISRVEFIRKKADISDKITRISENFRNAEILAAEENSILDEINSISNAYDAGRSPTSPLTRKIANDLIAAVIIHDEQNIEVKLTFDALGKKAVDFLGKINI